MAGDEGDECPGSGKVGSVLSSGSSARPPGRGQAPPLLWVNARLERERAPENDKSGGRWESAPYATPRRRTAATKAASARRLKSDTGDFAKLAEEVMGKKNKGGMGGNVS